MPVVDGIELFGVVKHARDGVSIAAQPSAEVKTAGWLVWSGRPHLLPQHRVRVPPQQPSAHIQRQAQLPAGPCPHSTAHIKAICTTALIGCCLLPPLRRRHVRHHRILLQLLRAQVVQRPLVRQRQPGPPRRRPSRPARRRRC